MAQHDYVISDQSFPAFRADLNNALAAIASNNSGSAAPSVTYAYMPWADAGAGLWKMRNASNSDWIVIGSLALPNLGVGVPAGVVVQVSGNVAPAGYVKANGATYTRAEQAGLWAWAQASGNLAASQSAKQRGQYGPGNGTTTFTIPNLGGQFVRAWDDGAGIDPGRGIGTEQASQIGAHTHPNAPLISSPGTGTTPGLAAGYFESNQTTGSSGGTENRPGNVALLYCIKT